MKITKMLTSTALVLISAALFAPSVQAAPKKGGTATIIATVNPRHFNAAVQSGVATMEPGAQRCYALIGILKPIPI